MLTGGRGDAARGQAAGTPAPGFTDEGPAQLAGEREFTPRNGDARAYQIAQQIAQRLSLRGPRRRSSESRWGTGALASNPYRGASDDVDLDRTLEVLAERPVPDDEDIIVRERVRARRSVVLAVDVSGSMRGERIQNAAAAVGALAGELRDEALAVMAFWSDAVILLPLGAPVKPLALLDDLLAIPARGLTNLAFPLELAAQQLTAARGREKRVILLTDAVHNAGPDPREAAAGLEHLDVLLDLTGEHDLPLGRDIAAAGHGMLLPVHHYRDIAPALTRAFRE